MRIRSLCVLLALGILILGVLWLTGCSSSSSSTSNQTSSTVAAEASQEQPVSTEPSAPAVEATAVEQTPSSEPATAEASPETAVEEPSVVETPSSTTPEEPAAGEPILTWARDAGGLNHCDRMSIYADGRVEAVVCKTGVSEPAVFGTLTDEQLTQLLAWMAQYSSFTRREMEMSRAVRATTLNGTGDAVPDTDTKVTIAAFAAQIYFSLTGTD